MSSSSSTAAGAAPLSASASSGEPAGVKAVQHWLELLQTTSPAAQALLQTQSQADARHFADTFYSAMLGDAQARAFLTHDLVNSRLRNSMQRWIGDLLSTWTEAEALPVMEMQRHVGAVHARIGIRMELVMRGARLIKRELVDGLMRQADKPSPAAVEAMLVGCELIDLATELMSAQYASAHETAARADEAYRSYASSMNMSLERERQRTAMLDWEKQFLQAVMIARPDEDLPPIGQSSFGLWIQHKAAAIFSRGSELASIEAALQRIDRELLPQCQREAHRAGSDALRRSVRAVSAEVEQIRHLQESLFDHLVDLEAGRDALTQLLNRRFLPSILTREIELSRRSAKSFSLLLIDVDHFKDINDRHGHDAGDRVLQHLANVLVNAVRSGDFVFRYGGEEFLIISVELSPEQALQVAEKIRRAVQAETFALSDGHSLRATISIGVAAYDGHPDYQHLIARADDALYVAKQGGRNRCVMGA